MDCDVKDWLIGFTQGKGLFMFIRAQLSAQVATVVDFLVSIVLNQGFGIYYVYATLTGSVSGGLVNCAINYKWTFHTEDCGPMYVLFKYLLVWLGSIGLNLWGTYLLTEFLTMQQSRLHLTDSTAFILSRAGRWPRPARPGSAASRA